MGKVQVSKVEICVMVIYGPTEGDVKERERFWNDLDRIGNGYRLCALSDLNGWVGDRVRVGITGGFGVWE